MNYNKLDKIALTNEDALKIMIWDKENHNRFTSIEFPLTEGVMLVTSYVEEFKKVVTAGTYFKVVSDGIEFTLLDWNQMIELASFKMGEDMQETGKFSNIKFYHKGMTYEEMHKDFAQQAHLLMATFQYMNHYKETVIQKKVRTSIVKKLKHKQSSTKSRTVKLSSVVYALDFTKQEDYGVKRSYERKTESWKQRGFWRHYKSGKSVWIAEQTKGTGKNVEPKTYRM